uniref:Carboxypeptidase n=1 Tax=Meloidogyne hapla TaxID=6305 RepID=A0A1I8BUJ1_MELHA
MNLLNYIFQNIFIKIFLLILFCFNVLAQDNGEKDLITGRLPLQDFELNFKHYSGYLQVSKTKFLHYVLTKSQNNPEKAPLVLWLNGGPPCSSLLGLFIELGPYLLAQDGSKLIKNPSTWNNNANMLYLESPAGVGYSYSTDGNITSSDDETAKYNYEALKQFFNKFPTFKGRPTVISGESYAGMYLPMLANLIIDGQKTFPINFKANSIINSILNGPLDPYDIYGNCRQIPSKTSTRNNLKVVSKDEGFDQPIVPCVNFREVLHIPTNLSTKWQECSDDKKYSQQYG